MSENNKVVFSNIFLLALLAAVVYFSFLIFQPFLQDIIIAGILVTIFYPAYLKLLFWTKGRVSLSAFIMCILVLLIVIVPFSYFIYYLASQIINLYANLSINGGLVDFIDVQIWQKLNLLIDKDVFDVQKFIIDSLISFKAYIIPGATTVVKGTTNFFTSLLIILFTMFFMFCDGRVMLARIMQLTPLSNKYDKLIWQKFRNVSYSAIVATFVTSFAQAITGAFAFLLVGLPALLGGILIFFFSILPYVGAAMIWLPAGIYLIIVGKVGAGIFVLVWGSIVVSLIDNVLRPYLMKEKTEVHPLIIFFSIIGGIMLMGFWGIIFGPLIISLAFTILHIYELEYADVLER